MHISYCKGNKTAKKCYHQGKKQKATVTLKTYSSGIYLRPSENSTQINQGQVKSINKIPKSI